MSQRSNLHRPEDPMSSRPPTGVTLLLLFFLPFLPLGQAQTQGFFSQYQAANPIAVRSPYLSCWFPLLYGTTWAENLLSTSDLSQVLGWNVLVNIDSITYVVLGPKEFISEPFTYVTINDTTITPTQIVLTTQAGPMQVNLTYLSPIEPGDFVKQSIPFSYLSVTAASLDNSAHRVQVYSDVTGEWMSANRAQDIQWNVTSNTNVTYHTVSLVNPIRFSEVGVQAEWGTLYYAMKSGNTATYKISNATTARSFFGTHGTLDNNQANATTGAISDFTVFAMSYDLGTIQVTQAPVVWAIGYTTDPAISYTDQLGSPPEMRSAYYKLQYSDDAHLIVDFLNDFNNASSRAHQLDLKVLHDAANVSSLFVDLASPALAAVYGSTQLTIGTDANGNFNKSDVMMFMKNTGGAETNRINPVETLYAAFPALIYIDPALGAPLLEPLFRLQAHPNYSVPYAARDLGSNYPNVTGNESVHDQEVEQSGNMLIMTYAHARATGDATLISKYYKVLTSWANYLVTTLLFIHNQSSGDGLKADNQVNLAIKGIIAIQAMSEMSAIFGQVTVAKNYSIAAAQLYGQWKSMALGNDEHLLAIYNQPTTWTLGYNLFADIWLGTQVVESSVYNNHSIFISNLLLNADISHFGLPTDSVSSNPDITVTSWNLFVAATTPYSDLRSNLIERIYNRSQLFASGGVFPLNYYSADGSDIPRVFPSGYNGPQSPDVLGVPSPAQGAMFAPLARNAPVVSIKVNTTTPGQTESKSSKTAVISGAVIGAIAFLFAVIGVVAFVRYRHRRKMRDFFRSSSSGAKMEESSPTTVTPFNLSPRGETQSDSAPFQDSPTTPFDARTPIADCESPSAQPSRYPYSPTLLSPGLSGKELARLRAETSRPRQTSMNMESSGPQPEPGNVPIVTADPEPVATTPPSETQGLRSVVEALQREMQQLRAERYDAPPSYSDDGA